MEVLVNIGTGGFKITGEGKVVEAGMGGGVLFKEIIW